MADYTIERREIYGKEYLKVQLRDNDSLEIIQKLLSSLQSVKKVNITQNTRPDLTIFCKILRSRRNQRRNYISIR